MKQKGSRTNCSPDTFYLSNLKTQLPEKESACQHMADQLDASGECMYLFVSFCMRLYLSVYSYYDMCVYIILYW